MDSLGRRRYTKQGRCRVERHAVYPGRDGASPELVQLLRIGYGEDADDGALFRCRRQQGTIAVQRNAREWRVVRLNHVDCLHLCSIVYKDFSACGCDVIGFGRRVRRRLEGSGCGFGGQRIHEVVVLGRC